MPQTGFTPIITYNTATASAAPSAGNLTQGELAVNVTDKKIYTKNSGGSVVQVGSGPDATETLTNKTLTSPDINGGTIDGTVIGGTTPAAGSFTTLSASGLATANKDEEFLRGKATTSGVASYQTIYNSAGTRRMYQGYASSSTAQYTFMNEENGAISFGTNNVGDRLKIDGAGAVTIPGSVGIGRTATSKKFEVAGQAFFQDATQPAAYFGDTFSDYLAALYDPVTKRGAIAFDGTGVTFGIDTNTIPRFSIDANGAVTIPGSVTISNGVVLNSIQSAAPTNLHINGYLPNGAVQTDTSYVRQGFDTNTSFNSYWKATRGAGGSFYAGTLGINNGGTQTDCLSWNQTGAVTIPGSLSLTGGTFGYGAGAGGTVTQATSKSTAVTLNKPCGQITMNNAALAAGASVDFVVNNTTVAHTDLIILTGYWGVAYSGSYRVETTYVGTGSFGVRVTNITAGSLSEALIINFSVISGATS